MNSKTHHIAPKPGLRGLIENWRSDLLAAVSVALVAMPLGLGIAVASGAPPISGIISAIIGGLVATLFGGSHLSIKGPAAGLIAVVLAAVVNLDDGSGRTLHYVLAAICVAGGLQVLLGALRLGKIAEMIPSSVIQGIMVAIGIIIFAGQLHVAMGTTSDASNTVGALIDAVTGIGQANPFIVIISLTGLLLLIAIPKIQSRVFQFFPASLWVLAASIPFVYAFNFFELHQIPFLDRQYTVGPEYLINIPTNLSDAFIFPDFSRVDSPVFWVSVISITLIASVQTLAMAKAVDKLDPYRRKTNLDRDLIGAGLATVVAGAIGGLPIINVIMRSTVNVHNNAKTKWSNFYHGLLLIVFVILLAPVIQQVPLAALAAILVYIGFKLAAPGVFVKAYEMGLEQLVFLVATTVITLYSDLLVGILGGTAFTLLVHLLLVRAPVGAFFRMTFRSGSNVYVKKDGSYDLIIRGIANFLFIPQLNKLIAEIPEGVRVRVDLSESRLVDLTFMENIIDFLRYQENNGGEVTIEGLENHVSSSMHNRALKILVEPPPQQLSPRQQRLQHIAEQQGYVFQSQVNWNTSYLNNFQFFETRPIERKSNSLSGAYPEHGVRWEMADVTFNEGVSLASEIFHATVEVVFLPVQTSKFVLEKEGFFDKLFDRVMAFSGYKDIDFELFPDFSRKYLLMAEDEEEVRRFFRPELIRLLEKGRIHHIESNGEALLIFRHLKLARTDETLRMLKFSEILVDKMLGQHHEIRRNH